MFRSQILFYPGGRMGGSVSVVLAVLALFAGTVAFRVALSSQIGTGG